MVHGHDHVLTDLHQILAPYVFILVQVHFFPKSILVVRRIESGFQSVTVENVEFCEHNQPSRRFLLFFIREFAIVELKELASLAKHIRYHSYEVIVLVIINICLWSLTAIHKDIALSAVPMHIAKHNDLVFHVRFQYLLRVIDGRVKDLGWFIPPSIEINAQHITAIVSSHNSIRVKHWDDFENELFSHVGCFLSLL